MSRPFSAALLLAAALCAGCDMLGIESAQDLAARKEADGRAVGGACRHAGRALEDCYALNRRADKAAVFAGWREMNDYMRENSIAEVVPQLGSATEVASKPARPDAAEAGDAKDAGAAKPARAAKTGKHES